MEASLWGALILAHLYRRDGYHVSANIMVICAVIICGFMAAEVLS